MKHYFIQNPNSGKNNKVDIIKDLVIPAAEKAGVDYEIYDTQCAGDATRFCKEVAQQAKEKGETIRIYAVGGDGTLYEVINGVVGYDNVEVTVVPKGSCNDYIPLYWTEEQLLKVEKLIDGIPLTVDALKVTDQDGVTEYAINQASLGFDAEACSKQEAMKRLPGAIGHRTYVLGGLYCMFAKVYNKFRVFVDGEETWGPFIQATAWVGQYYGSGIKGGTFGDPTDGLLDFSIIHRVMSWPFMFPYMLFHWQQKFDYYKYPFVDYVRGKVMTIDGEGKSFDVNVDGECRPVTKVTFESVPAAFTFILPKDTTFFKDIESGKTVYTIDQGKKCEEPKRTKLLNKYKFHKYYNQKLRGYGSKRK
ncbi:MAG: hypothetical protein IJ547_02740 [Clostridia bacterium]|nr:hypothetical protein [Clostridia bacterium]